MRISFNNNIYNSKSQSFKSQPNGRHCTVFCRPDLEWDKFCSFLENKYRNTDKVNTFILGGSDGSETYSYIMKMFMNLKNNAHKFMPVKTVEQNPVLHEIAESGSIPIRFDLFMREVNLIGKELCNAPRSYFQLQDKKLIMGSEIKQHAKFINDNLLNVLPEVPKSNTVLLMRNTLPYLNDRDQLRVINHIQNMDKSCTVAIGDYDTALGNMTSILLQAVGFKKTGLKNVFEKPY